MRVLLVIPAVRVLVSSPSTVDVQVVVVPVTLGLRPFRPRDRRVEAAAEVVDRDLQVAVVVGDLKDDEDEAADHERARTSDWSAQASAGSRGHAARSEEQSVWLVRGFEPLRAYSFATPSGEVLAAATGGL